MEGPHWYTYGRTTQTRKEQQRYLRRTGTYCRRRSKQGLDRLSYQEFYQCLVTGYKDIEIRSGWQSTGSSVKRLCKEEEVGYVDVWDCFVGKEEMYMRDGLHLGGKGAVVFAEGLSGAVASGLGKVRYLN